MTSSAPTKDALVAQLNHLANEAKVSLESEEFAKLMDKEDPLKAFRDEFYFPTEDGKPLTYFCGNSLGLQAKRTRKLVEEELDVWAQRGVEGHFDHPKGRPWAEIEIPAAEYFVDIVGAKDSSEIAVMQSLTNNLHLLMLAFYKPTSSRYKIIMEKKAFPSDQYAIDSQIKFHGLDPKDALIEVCPRDGETILRTEDILQTIEKEGSSIALVLFSGVQYYTGQFFDLKAITDAGHAKGCVVGFDLAHAVGNVPLRLHEWGVDFSCWCTYKYLNSGPGGIAGLFVHEDFSQSYEQFPGLAGWWGHDRSTRFDMPPTFKPIPGAHALQLSNVPVMTTACLLGSLQVFKEAGGMNSLRTKSLLLTQYMQELLDSQIAQKSFRILTPRDPAFRGCQISLSFPEDGKMMQVFKGLRKAGIVCDERKPDCIRLAPVPLYNSFQDVWKVVHCLKSLLGPKEGRE